MKYKTDCFEMKVEMENKDAIIKVRSDDLNQMAKDLGEKEEIINSMKKDKLDMSSTCEALDSRCSELEAETTDQQKAFTELTEENELLLQTLEKQERQLVSLKKE